MHLECPYCDHAQTNTRERDIIMSRVRSRQKWARRRFWLRVRAHVFGRRQVRMPENCSCHVARSSSVILRNVTSGTEKA